MSLFSRNKIEAATPRASGELDAPEAERTFLPRRARRRAPESALVRLVATGGIIGLATAIAAIMGTQEIDAWIVGLVVATVSVILAAILWSSREL